MCSSRPILVASCQKIEMPLKNYNFEILRKSDESKENRIIHAFNAFLNSKSEDTNAHIIND